MLYIAIVAHMEGRRRFDEIIIEETELDRDDKLEEEKGLPTYVMHWTGDLHNFKLHRPDDPTTLPDPKH